MRTITIKQPYASLICAGIQTELFVNDSDDYRGKVLVISDSFPFSDDEAKIQMPRKQYVLLDNAMQFDALPGRDQDLLTNAILGVVEITACEDAETFEDSIWKMEGCKYCLTLANAMEFDKAILLQPDSSPTCELDSFTEDNLPALHTPFKVKGWTDGAFYFIKVKDESLDVMLRDMLEPEPYDWNSVIVNPQAELGLTLSDRHYVENKLQYLCFVSDRRIIPLEVTVADYDYFEDYQGVMHDESPDYLEISISFDNTDPHIININSFSKDNYKIWP